MICSLLCFMEREVELSSSSCNLIYFVHMRKIPFSNLSFSVPVSLPLPVVDDWF